MTRQSPAVESALADLSTETTDHWMETQCFSTSVRRIDRVLSRLYDEALRPSGLVTTQYSLLSTLGRAPSNLALTQLAEAMVMDRTTLSRNLLPLEREGYVLLQQGDDRRSRYVTITPLGRDKLAEVRPLWKSVQDHVATVTAGHGNEPIEDLLAQLADLVAPIRQPSPESM